jgi:DNA-directed RNA polymerase subunit RPC12/RpoP
MKEIWKPVKGYEGLYEISNLGYVISLKKGDILKPIKNKAGFNSINLSKDGKRTSYTLHYLIAEYFLPQPEKTTGVIHKDKNKSNNCVSNLMWINKNETRICNICKKEFVIDVLQTWAKHYSCRSCKSRQFVIANPERSREIRRLHANKSSQILSDSYIRSRISRTVDVSVSKLYVSNEIIEAQRQILKIKRICKQLSN